MNADTFRGMNKLQILSIFNNKLHTLEDGSLAGLPALNALSLRSNSLTRVPWTVFSPSDFPARGHPAQLWLELSENPILCDFSLCWAKMGVVDGWLYWWGGRNSAPQCVNTEWDTVDLKCTKQGEIYKPSMALIDLMALSLFFECLKIVGLNGLFYFSACTRVNIQWSLIH